MHADVRVQGVKTTVIRDNLKHFASHSGAT